MSLPEELIGDSTLTKIQVESLASYLDVLSHHTTMREVAASRKPKPVTVGSYHRTVQQGRNNIKSSLRTVIVAVWFGFAKPDDLRRLLDLTAVRLTGADQDRYDRLAPVIEALISKIVM